MTNGFNFNYLPHHLLWKVEIPLLQVDVLDSIWYYKVEYLIFEIFDIYKVEVDVLHSIWYLQKIFDIYKKYLKDIWSWCARFDLIFTKYIWYLQKKYLKDIWSWCAWFDLIFTKLIKRVGWFYCLDKIQISIWYLIVDIWYFDIWYLIFTYWDQFEVDVLDSIWYLQSSSKEWDASTALIAFKYLFHKILLEIGLTLL